MKRCYIHSPWVPSPFFSFINFTNFITLRSTSLPCRYRIPIHVSTVSSGSTASDCFPCVKQQRKVQQCPLYRDDLVWVSSHMHMILGTDKSLWNIHISSHRFRWESSCVWTKYQTSISSKLICSWKNFCTISFLCCNIYPVYLISHRFFLLQFYRLPSVFLCWAQKTLLCRIIARQAFQPIRQSYVL